MSEIISENSQTVQTHLGILQGVIQRMATNSSSCKSWCITIVSAILVIVADKGKPQLAFLALIPTFLFVILDSYYLSLERCFVKSYNVFVKRLHSSKLTSDDLFSVAPTDYGIKSVLKAFLSFSVWPFYLTLAVMTYIAMKIIL
ncbi:hypothetical protein JNM05_16040 [bacterium]|nr:hypothetical protein [bacterium]